MDSTRRKKRNHFVPSHRKKKADRGKRGKEKTKRGLQIIIAPKNKKKGIIIEERGRIGGGGANMRHFAKP